MEAFGFKAFMGSNLLRVQTDTLHICLVQHESRSWHFADCLGAFFGH